MTVREKMEDVLGIVLALAAFYVLWTCQLLAGTTTYARQTCQDLF